MLWRFPPSQKGFHRPTRCENGATVAVGDWLSERVKQRCWRDARTRGHAELTPESENRRREEDDRKLQVRYDFGEVTKTPGEALHRNKCDRDAGGAERRDRCGRGRDGRGCRRFENEI